MSIEAAKPVETTPAERADEQIENTRGKEWENIGDEIPFAGDETKAETVVEEVSDDPELAHAKKMYKEWRIEQAIAKEEKERPIKIELNPEEPTDEAYQKIREAVLGKEKKPTKEVFTKQEIAAYEKNPKFVTYQIAPGEYKAIKREKVMDTLEDKLAIVSDEDPGMDDINHLMNIVSQFRSGFSEADKNRVKELKETNAYKIGTIRAEIGRKEDYLEAKKKSLDACNTEMKKLISVYGVNLEGSDKGRTEYDRVAGLANYLKQEINKVSGQIQMLNGNLDEQLKKEPAMIPYLQGSKESVKFSRDPGFVTVPLTADRGYAIKRGNVLGAINDLVINGDEDSEIQMADMLINKVALDGSGFSEEEKKQAEAFRETPQYKERSYVRKVNAAEKQRDRAFKDLEHAESSYEALMAKNKDVISRFLNRYEIDTAEQRIKEARSNIGSAENDLKRLKENAPLSKEGLEQRKASLIPAIRNEELAVRNHEIELAKEEESLADLLRQNRNIIDKFMNRKKIKEVEEAVAQKRAALNGSKESLSKMNAELTRVNKELLTKANGQN